MKSSYFYLVILTFMLGCGTDNETKQLSLYLDSFGYNLEDYKVIAFVPADGCANCIRSTLDFAKKANGNFLMVLSSISEKTNNHIIKVNHVDSSKIIIDSHNLAAKMKLVPLIAPCYYFIENGRIDHSIDLTIISDKNIIIKEVEKFIANK